MALSDPTATVGIPEQPEGLSAKARAEWDRMAPILLQLGTITRADGETYAAYCEHVAYLAEIRAELETDRSILIYSLGKDGTANLPRLNPLRKAHLEAMKAMLPFASHFGLTPATRSKISAALEPRAREDPWAS